MRSGLLCRRGAMLSGSGPASSFCLRVTFQGDADPHHPHFPDEELRLTVINTCTPDPELASDGFRFEPRFPFVFPQDLVFSAFLKRESVARVPV